MLLTNKKHVVTSLSVRVKLRDVNTKGEEIGERPTAIFNIPQHLKYGNDRNVHSFS